MAIATEEVDATKEITHVNRALGACSYPTWSFKRVREQLDQQELKMNLKINKNSKDKSTKSRVTLPYVSLVSEVLSQVFCHHGVVTSMKHHMTLKRMLVHPKDKCTPQENVGVVYQVP